MISWLAIRAAPIVGERFARLAAWIVLLLVLAGVLFIAKGLYDRSVIMRWSEEARVEFDEKQGQAEDDAEETSDERRIEHAERVKTTEELIDEAVAKGCAVGEYLASGGTRCL